MIVKNEAATLERCLRLARPHVDEVVVVDTGSTDGTREIARRYADVFDEIAWPDSFAAARNHSFDFATCDFILWLDGDEYLPEERHWRRLRKALRGSDVAGIQLPVRNLMPEGQILASDRLWMERLVRNDARLRFTGRVHNQIQEALVSYLQQTGRRLIRVEAEVIHTGYALPREQMKEKYRTRLHLLRAEYVRPRSERHRAYYGYQLGVIHYVLEAFDAAAAVFGEIDYGYLTPENAFYAHMLAAQSALKTENAPMALVHCNRMLTLDRSEPVAYYTTGLALLSARKVGDGLLMLMEAFNINEGRQRSVRFALNPRELLRMLARICTRVGLARHAVAFEALAAEEEYRPESVQALITSLKTGIVLAEEG